MKFYCQSNKKDYLEVSRCGDELSLEVVFGSNINDVMLKVNDIDILISEMDRIKKEIENEK